MQNFFLFAGNGRQLAQTSMIAALSLCVTVQLAGCGGGSSSNNTQQTASGGSGGGSGSGGSGSGGSGSGGSGSGGSGSGGSGSGGSGSGSGSGSGDAQPAGTTLKALQTKAGHWQSWGQIGPKFLDCKAPCKESSWQQVFGVESPSESGNATKYSVNPKMPYADVLFSAQVIGANAQKQDGSHKLLPTIHDLTYDTDFYVNDSAVTQSLEFDLSLWMSGVTGEIFGTQCDHLGDGQWDIWDNKANQWKGSGKPCKFVDGWNHVTLEFEREANNDTLYKSITLNGTAYALNIDYPPTKAPGGWWGLTANYQMDGDSQGSQNVTYLDNMQITYQ